MISKSAIFGGISFFCTIYAQHRHLQNDGTTKLYCLYYFTGRGYAKRILDIFNTDTVTYSFYSQSVTEEVVAVKFKTELIGDPPPGIGLHTGKEEGAKAFNQLSNGGAELLDLDSAIHMKSAITDWWDRTD